MYFQYNAQNDNENDEVYSSFKDGSIYKNHQFFQDNPNCIQIQIAFDDFEPCSPLQSKANRHKICATYFIIRNLPTEFQSKLDNVYVLFLCNADDIKTKTTDFNNLWQLIVEDILFLEEAGINVDAHTNIKRTLVQLAFDNLGANSALGFAASFASTYYCRLCRLSKDL